jgi:hypothetical protein
MAPEDRREKARSLRTEVNAKMKEILTADQYQKFVAMRGHNRPQGPKADGANDQNN